MKILVTMFAALALVLAACGGSSSDGVATLQDTASAGDTAESVEDASTEDSDEESLLAFAACMRDNGVEGFEDPVVGADGAVGFAFTGRAEGGDSGPFGGVDREVMESAFQVCGDSLEGVAFGRGGEGFDIGEFEDTFVEFAACMRENGVQMDDPDFSSFGPGQGGEPGEGGESGGGRGPFGDIDIDDPEVQAALEACQEIFGSFGPGAGGGRLGGGGG